MLVMTDPITSSPPPKISPEISEVAPARQRARLGRYAEFMVCAELTKRGYYVTHCDAPGFDLILIVGEKTLRVQVRSTSNITVKGDCCVWMCRKGFGSRNADNFLRSRPINRSDADLLALYHHVFATTVFVGVGDINGGSVRLQISDVRNPGSSLQRVLDQIL